MIVLPRMAFVDWSYDAMRPRRWDDGEVIVSLEATGELYWAFYGDDNASVVVQGVEDFERSGAPVASEIDVRDVLAYLAEVRQPGTSTHLLLGAETPVSWQLDGRPLAMPFVPGPEGSSVMTDDRVTWRVAYGPWWARVLVAPGAHVVNANGLEIRVLVEANTQCLVVVENDKDEG